MMMPLDLEALQREVTIWAEATFADTNARRILAHLKDEVRELEVAVEETYPLPFPSEARAVEDEAADVFLILLHLCSRQGVDLAEVAVRKFAECRARRWEHDPERGYARHVAGEEEETNAA